MRITVQTYKLCLLQYKYPAMRVTVQISSYACFCTDIQLYVLLYRYPAMRVTVQISSYAYYCTDTQLCLL